MCPAPASHDPSRRPNRLAGEKSPYLLQHAHNPVDWLPWGEEAFERARREDKPIFLSVGYSSCHWCHVMERESFENDAIARELNEKFVPVKVDREERPDVDEIYMTAVQLTTGAGGWPMSVFLTPDRKPFFAGTYFPPEDRFGRVGFGSLLTRLAEAWRTRRADVTESADRIADAVRSYSAGEFGRAGGNVSRGLVDRAVDGLKSHFDEANGGFGGPPKFPAHGSLGLLLEEARVTGDPESLRIATRTLDAMARGGIHDQIGGGFHRYSTDTTWLVPHFEKMLYDNAQLLRAYTDAYALTKNAEYRRVALGIVAWVRREMTGEHGAFYSALDADSEGEEGKYYVWTLEEIVERLGRDEGAIFARTFGVREGGNWRDEATGSEPGTNILHRSRALADLAAETRVSENDRRARIDRSRETLLSARSRRVPPGLDDKVLTAWNGLMIGALAHAGRVLAAPELIESADRAARFVLATLRDPEGRLLHTYRDGVAKIRGYLDDHTLLAGAALDLREATGDASWLDLARELMGLVIARFQDGSRGGFFFVPDDHEDVLLARSKDPFDKAIPSGNGAGVQALVRLFEITGDVRYRDAAMQSFEWQLGLMKESPRAVESTLLALARWFDGGSAARDGTAPAEKPDSADEIAPHPDAHAESDSGIVRAKAFAEPLRVAPGGRVRLTIELAIRAGFHVNTDRPEEGSLVATRLSLGEGSGFRLSEIVYPPGTADRALDGLRVYQGRARISATLEAPAKAADAASPLLRLRFQACEAQSCRAPEEIRLAVPIRVDSAAGA